MSKETEQNPTSKIHTISEDSNTLGEIHINHSVVASIVRLAALEVPGVAEVRSGGGFVDGITEIFSKKSDERGVQIDQDEVGDYKIQIRVVLRFGAELAAVGKDIQQHIVEQVEKMTSKNVARIDVIIDEVQIDNGDKKVGGWDGSGELD